MARLKTAAAIHPAVPPPTITTRLIRKSLMPCTVSHQRNKNEPAGVSRRGRGGSNGLVYWNVYENPIVYSRGYCSQVSTCRGSPFWSVCMVWLFRFEPVAISVSPFSMPLVMR